MIAPSHNTKIFLCRKPVDFRFGFDRLSYLCKSISNMDPYNGNVFLFFNRSYTRAKVIFYDGSGCVMLWKRLEKSHFKLPQIKPDQKFIRLGGPDLLLLLEGVQIEKIERGKTWNPIND